MREYADEINRLYGAVDISSRILERLVRAGKDVHALTRDDLTPFDEFHGGGRASTRSLAELAALAPGTHVLDIGSGVGGPARTLAAEFGCRVTGLDLTEEITPGSGDVYFLVAPLAGGAEGTLGSDSAGLLRAEPVISCATREAAGCP